MTPEGGREMGVDESLNVYVLCCKWAIAFGCNYGFHMNDSTVDSLAPSRPEFRP